MSGELGVPPGLLPLLGGPADPFPPPDLEDDKISLPFVVTDLSGRSLRPLRDRAKAQVGLRGPPRSTGTPQEPVGGWAEPW